MAVKRLEGVGEAHLFKGNPREAANDIDSWFQELLTETKEPYQRAHLWGADAGLCARRNVLLRYNESISCDVSATSNAYMSIGVALEDMLAEGLRRNQRLLSQGMYLVDVVGLKVRGRTDLIVLDKDDELALIEVKTCGKMPTEPRATHLAQAQTYAAVSGIRKTYITYISRNVQLEYGEGLSMKSFTIDTDELTLTQRLQTAWLSALAIEKKKLPPVPAHFRKHTECHYCEFRDRYCWKPRPGLKPTIYDPDPWPLPELSAEELSNLFAHAYDKALDSYNSIEDRYLNTLIELLNLNPDNERLKEICREAKNNF